MKEVMQSFERPPDISGHLALRLENPSVEFNESNVNLHMPHRQGPLSLCSMSLQFEISEEVVQRCDDSDSVRSGIGFGTVHDATCYRPERYVARSGLGQQESLPPRGKGVQLKRLQLFPAADCHSRLMTQRQLRCMQMSLFCRLQETN
ncbi:hypothetical protein CDAR_485931 [Caerostris darwini]|uniref:Uncharacterized protein n=1 Tax=Caerostris darwini TaxID=1538125 RepID=A0AAV4WJ63_9ARAC|nr:hypothetical protein CDAR_485931 [Caerostris darwini]